MLRVGWDDDDDCVHDFVLRSVRPTRVGVERVEDCVVCGAVALVPAQAAVRDRRPPLDDGTGATP